MTSPSSKNSQTPNQQVIEATVVDSSTNVSATTVEVTVDAVDATVVDVTPGNAAGVVEERDAVPVDVSPPADAPAPPGGGLVVVDQGSFKSFKSVLAPLKRDTFKQVVSDVEAKLGVVNQTLSMLDVLNDNQGGFESVLEEMLVVRSLCHLSSVAKVPGFNRLCL